MRVQHEHADATPGRIAVLDDTDIAVAVLDRAGELARLERRAHARVLARRHVAAEHERLRAPADAAELRAHEQFAGAWTRQPLVANGAVSWLDDPERAC